MLSDLSRSGLLKDKRDNRTRSSGHVERPIEKRAAQLQNTPQYFLLIQSKSMLSDLYEKRAT